MNETVAVAVACMWCDKPGVYLCDYRTADGKSCSAPFCAAHRYRAGGGIACSRGKGGGGRLFSIDYCPAHSPRSEP